MTSTPSSPAVQPLGATLAEAREALAAQPVPPQVAQTMWAAFEQQRQAPAAPAGALLRQPSPQQPLRHTQQRALPWWRRLASGLAWTLTGTVAAASLVALLLDPRVPEAAVSSHGTAFMPVAAPERWREFNEQPRGQRAAWVVRAELPRASLAAMGLPYDPARAGEPVRAELLMHPAGDVLAVRFLTTPYALRAPPQGGEAGRPAEPDLRRPLGLRWLPAKRTGEMQ